MWPMKNQFFFFLHSWWASSKFIMQTSPIYKPSARCSESVGPVCSFHTLFSTWHLHIFISTFNYQRGSALKLKCRENSAIPLFNTFGCSRRQVSRETKRRNSTFLNIRPVRPSSRMSILLPLPVLGPVESISMLPSPMREWITPSPSSPCIMTAGAILESKIFPLKYAVSRMTGLPFYQGRSER